jgi:hypothetical protein
MRKDYIWPVICAILVSSLALAIFPFGKPTSFYKLFSGLSINWKVGGVWIDLLLDVSFTYLTAAAFAALIASLTFKRSKLHGSHLTSFSGPRYISASA